ncbi:phage tail protein X [Tepidimonas ignava]|uniref:Phage tail protein X n=1 Tax=Tepidimonas ignava TaxID=114249 RepID=A0A4R3LKP3_9BURK|nr:tail protein X [Tepidimonas ignava]TCS99104.1 phage tail protein X [Tepidimonas ignava]TSE22812.1 Phage Tail Protein X [Tepidimonas ignava]
MLTQDDIVVMAREGDMIDYLVWMHYRRLDVLPQVLRANRHLARLSADDMLRLPDGTPVRMPALVDEPQLRLVRLWS